MSQFDFLHIDAKIENGEIIGKAGGSLGELLQPFVDKFFNKLNSLKVIAKVNGAHVYNLYNPPHPTEAGMRFLVRSVKMMLHKRAYPVTANIAITHKCQCRCIHCSADPFVDPTREELTTEEIKTVVDGALELGASLIIYVGGEPLLRDDLPELIEHVDKSKAIAMIFTNGLLLTDANVKRLAKAGLATLNISIDSSEPELHNKFRAVPGCYQKAFDGAARAREAGILTGISTYASRESLRSGQVEKLLQIAQREGFHEVTIFDCIPSGRYLKDTSKILSPDDRRQLIALSKKYYEMDHPMGVNAMALINSPLGVGCYGAQSQFYMTAYGDINPCDFNPINFGNVRQMPIQAIWHKMTSHPDFNKRYPTCRMQSKAYRKKYIDPLPPDVKLPVAIEDIPNEVLMEDLAQELALAKC
ncbi:MAG TPA: radical SAM protein [Candidatus Brocadiia bacterium]|nr:radical SAM protein [Candidatus Brocadiales bacterium]